MLTHPALLLLPGPDARLLGMSVRTRNTRVAARYGAVVVTLDELAVTDASLTVLVPPSVAIDAGLFPLPAVEHATWLESNGPQSLKVPAVLVGPSAELRVYAANLEAARDLPKRAIPEGSLLDVSSPAALRRAGWWLLQRTGKANDGWVSRVINRRISRVVSYALLTMRFSPAHATALVLLVGLAAGAIGSQPGPVALAMTGILFQLASVLDGVDGEIARTTLTESEAGARLDAAVDRVTLAMGFLGVTAGWVREGADWTVLAWMTILGVAITLSALRTARFVGRHAPHAEVPLIDRSIRRAARESGGLALRVSATLLQRDAFALLFMGVGFTGIRALVPILATAGVLIANAAFSVHEEELAAAVRAEAGSL
jgi:phosphatidylglycerophosphate synthase